MGVAEALQITWCSKKGIVKTGELLADDHPEHTARALYRKAVSSQGLISPPIFPSANKDPVSPAPPHTLTQIKEFTPFMHTPYTYSFKK